MVLALSAGADQAPCRAVGTPGVLASR